MNTRSMPFRIGLLAGLVAAVLAAMAIAGYHLAQAAPEGTAGVVLNPPADAKAGPRSSDVAYILVFTNTGASEDTYTVTLAGYTWPTTFTIGGVGTLLLPLGAGMSESIEVTVTVPADATGFDVATVTVTSANDAGVSDSSVLTTSVRFDLYMPYLQRSDD